MFSELVLTAWTLAGLAWWLISWRLVVAGNHASVSRIDTSTAPGSLLTIFKPLPPQTGNSKLADTTALESFIAQLDAHSELLLGVHEADRSIAKPFVAEMRERYPTAAFREIYRTEPDAYTNPKISWLKIMEPQARGELWLWSDADIVAPPGFLAQARDEYLASNRAMMTFPYVVREAPCAPALLDALFVNAEFYPGVLLLRRRGSVDFGLGAGMLFSRNEFQRRVDWADLGEVLADDFVLGQKLQPVAVGHAVLSTQADATTWREALLHHLRWSKTILWNRPLGTAGRIMVLPLLGWIGFVCWHPNSATGWIGLIAVVQMDVFFAALVCAQVGLLIGAREIAATEFWTIWRAFVWLICWLPWPVMWRGQCWWTSRIRANLLIPLT